MPTRKVTPELEEQIRSALAQGQTQADIARAFGVSQPAVSKIKNSSGPQSTYTSDAPSLSGTLPEGLPAAPRAGFLLVPSPLTKTGYDWLAPGYPARLRRAAHEILLALREGRAAGDAVRALQARDPG